MLVKIEYKSKNVLVMEIEGILIDEINNEVDYNNGKNKFRAKLDEITKVSVNGEVIYTTNIKTPFKQKDVQVGMYYHTFNSSTLGTVTAANVKMIRVYDDVTTIFSANDVGDYVKVWDRRNEGGGE